MWRVATDFASRSSSEERGCGAHLFKFVRAAERLGVLLFVLDDPRINVGTDARAGSAMAARDNKKSAFEEAV